MPGPCPYAMAMMRVPSTKWTTRAEVYVALVRARKLIERNPIHALDFVALAKEVSISPYHFHRLFRKTFGETPAALRSRLRYEMASQLLRDGSDSVTDICFRVGFASVGSFCREFSIRYGMSPTLYRLQFAN